MKLVFDGLRNLVSKLGTERDKAVFAEYTFQALSPQQLSTAYRGSWLPRKIVDIPALDAVRRWRSWNADADQIEALERFERDLQVQSKMRRALQAARLYGGSALYLGTGDKNLEEPLDPERVGKDGLRYLTVLSRQMLSPDLFDYDPESPYYNSPKSYGLNRKDGQLSLRIHPTRLVILKGAELPEDEIEMNSGWGDSVLQASYDALLRADSTLANIASLIYEAKIDVIRIPGLMEGLEDPTYEDKVTRRFTLAATGKGINGALILDKEEEYDQKSASFATLPDLADRFLQAVSGAADIPMTRLLGMSPAGMNSTGESDLRNYYDSVQSHQELVLSPALSILDELVIRSALGSRPEEIHYNWRSLWQTTDKERAEIGKIIADTIKVVKDANILVPEALAAAGSNALIEGGVLPGLESAMEEFGTVEDLDEEDRALDPATEGPETAPEPARGTPTSEPGGDTTDAAPRTLYVRRNVLNADAILRWTREQGFATTLKADDLHVTVVYSKAPVDWMKVPETWEETITIGEGGPRLMEQFGEARVLLFQSRSLYWRHREALDIGASWDYAEYQPHITISYDPNSPDLSEVEPYTGPIILGPEIFEEIDPNWKPREEG